MTATILVLVITALIAGGIAIVRWVQSDGDPRLRPQPRPQDRWSRLPTSGYTTSPWFKDWPH